MTRAKTETSNIAEIADPQSGNPGIAPEAPTEITVIPDDFPMTEDEKAEDSAVPLGSTASRSSRHRPTCTKTSKTFSRIRRP